MNWLRELKSYIFDLDGTLIDSEEAHLSSWLNALSKFSPIKTLELQRYFGLDTKQIAAKFINDEEKIELCVELKERLFDKLWREKSRINQYVRELLSYLKERGFNVAVASSNPVKRIEEMLNFFNIRDFFDVIAGREHAGRGKPHPDILLHILKKLETNASAAVYVGDSPFDVLTAKNAGVRSILLKYRYRLEVTELDVTPDLTVNSLYELLSLIKQAYL